MNQIIHPDDITKSQQLRKHLDNWCHCERCPLGEKACRHVMFSIYNFIRPRQQRLRSDPVDVMFIGEGPGQAEDVIGKPFVGPVGRFLRNECWPLANPDGLIVMLANLLACRPHDRISGPNRPPLKKEVEACRPRLAELIEIFDPLVIVSLGRVPEEYLPATLKATRMLPETNWAGPTFCLLHPSSICRKGGNGSVEFNAYVADLAAVFETGRKMKGTWRIG